MNDIYDIILEGNWKLHYLTSAPRCEDRFASKKRLFRFSQIEKAIQKQDSVTDLYISKYSTDNVVRCVILDFDSKDRNEAYNDVMTCHKYLKTKGLNSFIVDSTNKGYHLYIQIPPTYFPSNNVFKHYSKHLIGELPYPTLDMINFEAGLNGNIRLIGSIHPSTGKRVTICRGEPVDIRWDSLSKEYYKQAFIYHHIIFKNALYLTERESKQKKELNIQSQPVLGEFNPLSVDLREVFTKLFNLEKVTMRGDTLWACCPFHSDEHPSFLVTDNYYFCKGCGAKGNGWTLIKEGYWRPFKQENFVKIGGA